MNGVQTLPAGSPVTSLWQILASVRLSIALLLLLATDMAFGYGTLIGNGQVFEPMSQVGLYAWIETYGLHNLHCTLWFLLLLPLLALLVVNTLVCTVDRLAHLLTLWRRQGMQQGLAFSLSTHVMHLGLVVLLTGYLVSFSLSTVRPGVSLIPGSTVTSLDLTLELRELDLPPFRGEGLPAFTGRVLHPRAVVRLVRGERQGSVRLGYNRPAWFAGYALFLQRVNPSRVGGMSERRYIVVDIRRDPGIPLVFCGIGVFVCGLVGYVVLQGRRRQARRT
jgi:hypothetical protein